MTKFVLLIAIFALLSISNISNAQSASDYFIPLKVGNYLNLHTVDIPNYSTWGARTTRFYVDRTDNISGETYFRQLGVEIMDNNTPDTSSFQVFWLRKDSVGNVLVGAMIVSGNSKDLDSALVIYPAGPMFSNDYLTAGYSRFLGSMNSKDSVVSVTETAVTPAGTFLNCIKVCSTNYDSIGNIVLRNYQYYARGMGIVYEYRDIPVNETHTDALISSRTISSINDNQLAYTPNTFSLEQNYPNPFNPSTTINYSLSKAGKVRLSVYDMTGSKVATIVNENKPAGSYTVHFNGRNLASGIYLYRLESGTYSAVRKFILLK
ncbi:MAG: T9SS type A sorting domain-containing protein [Ignavibacteriaceae bacterium]|nr:T9SS type A sorting domain-containing protein [Ignavibacteriaceae bacterium]